MGAILTITQGGYAGEAKLELTCEHGLTLAFFAPGALCLTDEDLARILGNSHRNAWGCRCSDSLEIQRSVAVGVN